MATAAKKEGSVNHAAEEENANGADGVEDMDVDGEEGGGAGESVSKSDVPVPGSGVESKIPIERGAAGGKKHAKNEPGGRGESGGVVGGGGDGGGEGGDGGKSRVGESRTLDNTTEKYYHDKKASDPDIGEEGSNHEHEDEKTSSDKDQKGCFVPFFAQRPVYLPTRPSEWSSRDTQRYRHGYPDEGGQDYPSLNDNYLFYTNKIPYRPHGIRIERFHKEMWGNYEELEYNHSYIQWLFPIREQGMNWDAQELQLHEIEAIRKNQKAKDRLKRSYKLMLDFYGIDANEDGTQLRRSGNWKERFKNLNRSSHNYLRITRILKCLGDFGIEKQKVCLVEFLLTEAIETGELRNVLDSCMCYWVEALRDNGERERMWRMAQDMVDEVNARNRGKGGGGESKSMVGARPQPADLARELYKFPWSETVNFCVQLGMEYDVLRKIGEDEPASTRHLTAMHAWLESDHKASWKKVVSALRAIRKEVLAQELEEKYCRDGGSKNCENDGSSAATVAGEASGSSVNTHHTPSNPRAPQEVGCTDGATAAALRHSIPPTLRKETELVQAMDRAQQQLRQKEEQLRSSEALVADLIIQQRHVKSEIPVERESAGGKEHTKRVENGPGGRGKEMPKSEDKSYVDAVNARDNRGKATSRERERRVDTAKVAPVTRASGYNQQGVGDRAATTATGPQDTPPGENEVGLTRGQLAAGRETREVGAVRRDDDDDRSSGLEDPYHI